MKKSILPIYGLILITSFLFSGCSSAESSKQENNKKNNTSSVSSSSSSTLGSLSTNPASPNAITLSGTNYLSCVYDNNLVIIKDTIYKINHTDNNKIYSSPLDDAKDSKIDFSKVIKLSDDSTFSISTDNTYIYYNNSLGLFKISLDGKEKVTISKDIGSNLYISGDSLFYINKSDKNTLYKYSIAANVSRKITESAVLSYAINGDSIIYINKDDNCRIYTISSNGDNNNKITDYSATSFTICNNKIYYCNPTYDNYIFASNLDGTQSSLIGEASLSGQTLSCDDSGIYILNRNDFNRLYKISFDGKKNTKLHAEMLTSYSVIDKYIIITKKSDQKTERLKK